MKTVLAIFLFNIISISAFSQTCTGSVGDPIVDNTFGAGVANPGPALSPGITSMIYASTTCPVDGYYTIANYTANCFGGWITLTDHTGNANGYYMLVNATPTPNTFFVDTIYNLCGGVDYRFGAWVINLVATNGYVQPNLTFNIKTPSGTLLQTNTTGNIPISGTVWGLHSFNFTTPPGVTAVVLSINNNAVGGSGNDLAIDDISFRAVGPTIDVGIMGYTVDTVSFCGSIPALTLTSSVGQCYASTEYQWQRSSNGGGTWTDIAGANSPTYLPGISTYGVYLYRLTVAAQGNISSPRCRVVSSVISITYTPGPSLSISPKDTTVCPGNRVAITASGGTGTYIWSDGTHGTIDMVTATASASYIISVTNSSGCISTDTAYVHVSAPTQTSINQIASGHCAGDSVALYASGGTNYAWSNGATTSMITVLPVAGVAYSVTTSDAIGCSATATITPAVSTPFSIIATVIQPPCPGVNMGSINVSVSGSTSSYQYLWGNGETTPGLDSLAPGPYTLRISDASGCDTLVRFTLAALPAVQLSLSPRDTTVCPGSPVSLKVTGANSYQWSDSYTGANHLVTVSSDGSYIVTGTRSQECVDIDTAFVHVYIVTPPVISAISTGPCVGDSVYLTATGGASYVWSTGVTSASISIFPVTDSSYIVSATDIHGCRSKDTAITIATANWVINATVTDPPCPNIDLGIIALSVSGNSAGLTYAWSNGATTPNIDSLSPATYSVFISDGRGCDTAMSFTLAALPTVQVSISPKDTTVCPGSPVLLKVTGATSYQWSDSYTGANHLVTVSSDGSYVVTGTRSQGCVDIDTAFVHVYTVTPPVISSISTGPCAGDSVYLTATGGTSYTWSTGATLAGISIFPVTDSSYIVSATDIHECRSEDTVITVATANWIITPAIFEPPCPTRDIGSIELSASGNGVGLQYLWNNGDTARSLHSMAPGIYSVVISDADGCDTAMSFMLGYSYTLQVTIAPQDTTVPKGISVQLNTSVNSNNGNTFIWTPAEDISCRDCADPVATVIDSSYTYIVFIQDQYGCTATDTMHISTLHLGPIFIPNAFTPNGDDINDYFSIGGPDVSPQYIPVFEVKIFDRWGELIFESTDPNFKWDGVFKGTLMPPGVYVYLIDYLQAGTVTSKHAKGSLTLIR